MLIKSMTKKKKIEKIEKKPVWVVKTCSVAEPEQVELKLFWRAGDEIIFFYKYYLYWSQIGKWQDE